MDKNEKGLGKLQKECLNFIREVNGWHTYADNPQTKRIVKSLEKRGLVITNEFKQFRPS